MLWIHCFLKLFWSRVGTVGEMCWNCFETVRERVLELFGNVFGTFGEFIRKRFLELSGNSFGTFGELFGNCLGNVRELWGNCSGTVGEVF